MPGHCIHEVTGCMTYYSIMPLVWCHAIFSTVWKTVRTVYVMSDSPRTSAPSSSPSLPCVSKPQFSHKTSAADPLQLVLEQLEDEKAQRRRSRPPPYRPYDNGDAPPQLPPLNLDASDKLFPAEGPLSKRQTLIIRMDEKEQFDSIPQPQLMEKMSYVPALGKGVKVTVHSTVSVIEVH